MRYQAHSIICIKVKASQKIEKFLQLIRCHSLFNFLTFDKVFLIHSGSFRIRED
jgi:hypothetical protein